MLCCARQFADMVHLSPKTGCLQVNTVAGGRYYILEVSKWFIVSKNALNRAWHSQ